MGNSILPWLCRRDCVLLLEHGRAVQVNDYILLAWLAWGALCFIVGAVMMAAVRVERGELDEDKDNFDFWIDD